MPRQLMSVFEELPEGLVDLQVGARSVRVQCDTGVYPRSAVYGAAFVFIDRCYVFLDKPSDSAIGVSLTGRGEVDEGALEGLAGEFMNELLACTWRQAITEENRTIIDAVTQQALTAALGPPSLDDLSDFDFTDDALEDPLGIALSWEEKYGRKEGEASSGEATASAEAPAKSGAEEEE
jgi:His-Xaa-Ser system protein HxsD